MDVVMTTAFIESISKVISQVHEMGDLFHPHMEMVNEKLSSFETKRDTIEKYVKINYHIDKVKEMKKKKTKRMKKNKKV